MCIRYYQHNYYTPIVVIVVFVASKFGPSNSQQPNANTQVAIPWRQQSVAFSYFCTIFLFLILAIHRYAYPWFMFIILQINFSQRAKESALSGALQRCALIFVGTCCCYYFFFTKLGIGRKLLLASNQIQKFS